MATTNELKIQITGDSSSAMAALDKLAGAVKGTVGQVESGFGRLGSVIGNLTAPIAAITAALGGGKLFKDSVDETVNFSKEVGKLSKVMGTSREEATALAVGIGDIYGNTDEFLGGVSKLVKAVNANEDGLKRMGIATRDAQGHLLPMQQIITNTNNALLKYKEGADRDAAANAVLGKSWADWLKYLQLTPQVLDEARKKAASLHMVMDPGAVKRYRAAMNDVGDVIQAVKINVGDQLLPALASAGEWFATQGPGMVQTTIGILKTLGTALSYTTVQFTLLALALRGPLMSAWASLVPAIQNFALQWNLGVTLPLRNGAPLLATVARGITAMVNPWVLAGAAIVAAGVGIEYWSRAAERAIAKAKESADETLRQASSAKAADAEITRMTEALRGIKDPAERAKQAEADLLTLRTRIASIGPAYRTELIQQARSLDELAAAYRRVTKDQAKAELTKVEGQLPEAQRRVDTARPGFAATMKAYFLGDPVKIGEAMEKARKESPALAAAAKDLNDLLERKAQLLAVINGQEAKPESGTKQWGDQNAEGRKAARERILREIEDLRLGYEEKRTITQKEEAELAKLRNDTAKREGDIEKLRKTDPKGAEAGELALAFAYGEARLAIQAKYGRMRQDLEDQLVLIGAERLKSNQLTVLQMEDEANQRRRDNLEISEEDYLAKVAAIQERRYQVEKKALLDRIALGDLEQVEQARILAELGALDDRRMRERSDVSARKTTAKDRADGAGGAERGIKEYLETSRNAFETWRGFSSSILQSTESAFGNFFTSLTQRGQTFGQKIKALWGGISQGVVQALSKIAAQELVTWGIQKAKMAWDLIRSAWGTADTAKQVTEAGVKSAANTTEATTNVAAASSSIFKAHSSIPWVGVAVAAGMVMAMLAVMNSIKARAVGGLVTRPELTLLGEAGPELVAPEHDFKDWARGLSMAGMNLGLNLASHDQQISRLNALSGSYGAGAPSGASYGGPVHNYAGATIVAVDSRQWAEMVHKGLTRFGRS